MSLKRKDREMSVSSMISVRSENMSGKSRAWPLAMIRIAFAQLPSVISSPRIVIVHGVIFVLLFRARPNVFIDLEHLGSIRLGLWLAHRGETSSNAGYGHRR